MEIKNSANHFALLAFLVILGISVSRCKETQDSIQVFSPDERLSLTFLLRNGDALYNLDFDNKNLVKNSKLGFKFKNIPPLEGGFELEKTEEFSIDETWEQTWGEKREIRNHHNGLRVTLMEKNPLKRKLIVEFELFNDGLGFRYEFPEQENLGVFSVVDELTEFNMHGHFSAWSIGAYQNERNEYLYKRTKLSEISDTVYTPFILESSKGVYISIHEARLSNYTSMALYIDGASKINCDLVPRSDGIKVYGQTPFVTPWRTIQVADCPEDLLTSFLISNLNRHNKIIND